jgi:hypothetical protein
MNRIFLKPTYLAIAGCFLMLLLSYQLAFKNTITQYLSYRSLRSQLSRSGDISTMPNYNERKLRNLNIILNRYKADSITLRTKTTAIISDIAEREGASLTEVPLKNETMKSNAFILQQFNVEGDYAKLVKILGKLHNLPTIGVIRSFVLSKKPKLNSSMQTDAITMVILVENVVKHQI